MLTNVECISWHNRVGELLSSVWNGRTEILHKAVSAGKVGWINPTPESKVNAGVCYISSVYI